jgi:hypothetical protein
MGKVVGIRRPTPSMLTVSERATRDLGTQLMMPRKPN